MYSSSKTEAFQKLSKAAERRRIQNRNAQRKYRENLKKKLESYEAAGARNYRQRTAASSLSSSDFSQLTFDVDFTIFNFGLAQEDEFANALWSSQPTSPECSNLLSAPTPEGVDFNPIIQTDPMLSYSPLPTFQPHISTLPPFFTDNSSTMLHLAARKNLHTIIHLLLESGIDMTSQDASGQTPLHIAAEHGHVETLRTFLKEGVDMDIKNGRGETALLVAVDRGRGRREEVVRVLVESGAELWCGL